MSANKRTKERYAAKLLADLRIPDESGKKLSFDKIAAELGISKPQVHKLVDETRGYGPVVEEAVARRWFGGSVDKLQKAANAWAEQNPETEEADIFDRDPHVDARNGFVAQSIDDGQSKEDISAAVETVDGRKNYKGENTYDAWFQAYREALRNLRAQRKGKTSSPFGIGARKG